MRRFVALSLSFFILVNCFDIKSSASSFVNIKPTMSPDSDDIVSVSYIKPTQQDMPYFDASMSSFCIGLIEFKLKNPQKFMPNVKVNIKVSPPPDTFRIILNKFKSMLWPPFKTLGLVLLGEAVGVGLDCWKYNVNIKENIVDFIVGRLKSNRIISGGCFLGLIGGFLISDSGCRANDFKMSVNSIPFEYSLIPISEQEAKTLQENKVKAGEKKKDKKEYDQRYEEIQDANGPTFGEAISRKVLMKGYNILNNNNPNIDPGDPLGLMENAKFLKLDEYKYPRNFENYLSDKESKAINKQNAMKKSQFCKNHSDDQEGINVSNYSSKILVTLSRDNPVQYGAIMVNNSVEAAKLRKLLERSYSATSQLVYRLKNSFSIKLVLSLPDGSTADEDTEKKAEIALGTGPSLPARIVSFFVPHGVAGYASSLVDLAWKPIYSGGAWACDKIKSKFLIEKDPVWVIPQEDNPPWVVTEVEPGVDPPWTIPPKADPWYKRAWDKVKSWFRSSNDQPNQQQNNQAPPDGQQQGGQRPQDQQNQNNQNNQQQQQNPYNNGHNYYDPSAANGQAQQQGNQPPPGDQQQPQQNNQASLSAQQSHNGQQSTQRLGMYGAIGSQQHTDKFKGNGRKIGSAPLTNAEKNIIMNSDKSLWDKAIPQVVCDENGNGNAIISAPANINKNDDASNADSSCPKSDENDKSEINSNDNENNEEWGEPPPETEINLNSIPQGKNRDRNSSRNSTQFAFKTDD